LASKKAKDIVLSTNGVDIGISNGRPSTPA
jgi:hypothetical protein